MDYKTPTAQLTTVKLVERIKKMADELILVKELPKENRERLLMIGELGTVLHNRLTKTEKRKRRLFGRYSEARAFKILRDAERARREQRDVKP